MLEKRGELHENFTFLNYNLFLTSLFIKLLGRFQGDT